MMDSGSSGSMQSSSGGGGGGGGVGGVGGGGGDDDYDSRGGESISSFLNHQHPSTHFSSIINQQTPLHHHQPPPPPPAFFDLHTQNLEAFPQSLSSQYNNEMIWSRALRSEPNYTNFGNFTSSSSSSLSSSLPSSTQSLLGMSNQPPPPPLQSSVEASSSLPDHHHRQPNLAVKNPKKRTRASRRAPTTVLTTDTANFRQMVQEFTGIPAAPFSAATASPYSRRLDLFSTPSGGSLLFPLRTSPQKLSPRFTGSSSSTPLMLNSSGTNITTSLPSIAGTSNIFNMQNQLLTFQPLLQQQHDNLPLSMGNEPFFTSRVQGNTNLSSIDELGLSHHHQQHQQQQVINANNLSGFSNPGSSEATQVRNDDNLPRWRNDQGTLNPEKF